MRKKKVCIVVGTRPNFIKITQFKKLSINSNIEFNIIHTGQHFDEKMSLVFFRQLGLIPDNIITLSSGTAISQISEMMSKLELLFADNRSDMVMAVGDVNSTLAAAIVANKMGIKLAHLESGLRSYDRTMPEEVNRIVTDRLADYFFVTEESGVNNLLNEGVDNSRIFLVGNTMIDTMYAYESQINSIDILDKLQISSKEYILVTMHRPATVDHKDGIEKLIELLYSISSRKNIVFPVHPRTIKNIASMGIIDQLQSIPGLIITDPLDYFSFQKLIKESFFVLTDSGGIQEETTQRGVPCLTLRPNTERPITTTIGSNTLVPFNIEIILDFVGQIEDGRYKKGDIPPFWDGNSTKRIVDIIASIF